jgi:hypothetical protein
MAKTNRDTPSKPSAMLGTGQLVSSLWESPDRNGRRTHRFNIYRMNSRSGRVSRSLRPIDLWDLAKLCQALAATLADEASIPAEQRRDLADLSAKLDSITRTRS